MWTAVQSVKSAKTGLVRLVNDLTHACIRNACAVPIKPEFGGAIRRASAYTKRPV